MAETSPYILATRLQTEVGSHLASIDALSLPTKEAKLVSTIKRDLADARLDIRDYELSETRDEQLENAKIGRHRLDAVRRHILTASEYDIFNAIDVAQLTATIEHITGRLV